MKISKKLCCLVLMIALLLVSNVLVGGKGESSLESKMHLIWDIPFGITRDEVIEMVYDNKGLVLVPGYPGLIKASNQRLTLFGLNANIAVDFHYAAEEYRMKSVTLRFDRIICGSVSGIHTEQKLYDYYQGVGCIKRLRTIVEGITSKYGPIESSAVRIFNRELSLGTSELDYDGVLHALVTGRRADNSITIQIGNIKIVLVQSNLGTYIDYYVTFNDQLYEPLNVLGDYEYEIGPFLDYSDVNADL